MTKKEREKKREELRLKKKQKKIEKQKSKTEPQILHIILRPKRKFIQHREKSLKELLKHNILEKAEEHDIMFFCNNMDLPSLIEYISEKKKIKSIYACTWSLKKELFQTLQRLTHYIVASIIANPKFINEYIKNFLNLPKIINKTRWTLRLLRSHRKFLLIDTEDKKYVIDGSANLSPSSSMEQINISTCEKLYYDILEFEKTLNTEPFRDEKLD